jgi:histidine triad (HIT) family protein
MKALGLKIKELSLKLIRENDATGVNILNASGKDAQQSVMHLHFHIVPRYPNDGLDLWLKQKL